MVNYQIGMIPGTITNVVSNDGITIAQAVQEAGLQRGNVEVRLNGELLEGDELNQVVPEGGVIAVSEGRVKGNA